MEIGQNPLNDQNKIEVHKYPVDCIIGHETAIKDLGDNEELFYMMLTKVEDMCFNKCMEDVQIGINNQDYHLIK